MKIKIVFLTLSLILISCSSENNASFTTKVFNANVAASLINSDKELKMVRTELGFESGNKVNNCADYAKEIKTSNINEGVNNQLIKSEQWSGFSMSYLKRHSNN